GSPDRVDEVVEVTEARGLAEARLLVTPAPERPDRRPHLAHRLSAETPDRLERRACLIRALLGHVCPRPRLHRDRCHRVSHHVVELARGQPPLLDPPLLAPSSE